eukprot:TRINITY_DN23121_c0_g1_i2.p1 TRINITY_DN23121_c0_g1~~TRINITY_DN23121_c0_g1_i2.p1  ORF type:complete len:325 (+),score=76.03 TRINITY_DN23121_c0_g1_i2:548-1522(+)
MQKLTRFINQTAELRTFLENEDDERKRIACRVLKPNVVLLGEALVQHKSLLQSELQKLIIARRNHESKDDTELNEWVLINQQLLSSWKLDSLIEEEYAEVYFLATAVSPSGDASLDWMNVVASKQGVLLLRVNFTQVDLLTTIQKIQKCQKLLANDQEARNAKQERIVKIGQTIRSFLSASTNELNSNCLSFAICLSAEESKDDVISLAMMTQDHLERMEFFIPPKLSALSVIFAEADGVVKICWKVPENCECSGFKVRISSHGMTSYKESSQRATQIPRSGMRGGKNEIAVCAVVNGIFGPWSDEVEIFLLETAQERFRAHLC